MSSRSTKPKTRHFGSDIHRLLQAAEAGQKADILAYSSGHLGPRSLVLSQPHKETKKPFWSTSEKHTETPKHLTPRKQQTKAVKNNMKDYLAEVTADFASLTIDQALATDHPSDSSFDAVPREDACLNNSFPCMRKPLPKIQPKSTASKKSENTSSQSMKQYGSDKGLRKQELTKKPQDLLKNNIWSGTNAAEEHERKLKTELQKLSSQRWPSRDRLRVFSDVFGDVCESLPVFGHILREIKPSQHSLKLPGTAPTPELEDKKEEVRLLEQEAREALDENERLKSEVQAVLQITCPEDKKISDVSLSELESESADGRDTSLQSKRRQVLDVWTEIQQLEEEIRDKLVSTDITTAIDKHVRALKNEIVKFMVSSNKLEMTNKELEDQINTVLQREKITKTLQQRLWDEIRRDL